MIYVELPKLDLKDLQQKLRSAFQTFIEPFLTGDSVSQTTISSSNKWPPRVLIVSEGELFCTRLLEGRLEEVGVANFFDALHSLTPMPLAKFRKCEGCGRWFFAAGKGI